MFWAKLVLWAGIGMGIGYGTGYVLANEVEKRNSVAYRQFEDDDEVPGQIRMEHWARNSIYGASFTLWMVVGLIFFSDELGRLFGGKGSRAALFPFLMLTLASNSGCMRPFEPVVLKTVDTSEEGFLIPLRGDKTKQSSTNSEDDLRRSLVNTKQVQIPQQWIQTGYEWMGMPNGDWKDAAVLIKIDRAPVTCEWTADPNSGTSNKNEAIWVMTADQVEFSTGWTCTARISSRDDAIKFLHNYPSGSLTTVMNQEIRGKIQAIFGLEVTDLPMDTLRKAATPHISHVIKEVSEFFKERGIAITNLGISGGFVYKDKSVLDKLVEVFNAEQEKNIAAAATQAQDEKNKRIRMEAEGKASALLLEKEAEAKGIQAVADAKAYEIQKAQENKELYLGLKRIELESKRQERWDGRLPQYFMGGGGTNSPEMLLSIPELEKGKK